MNVIDVLTVFGWIWLIGGGVFALAVVALFVRGEPDLEDDEGELAEVIPLPYEDRGGYQGSESHVTGRDLDGWR